MKRPRVLAWSLAALAFVAIIGWAGLAVVAHRAGPYLRERVVQELNQRFDGSAELESLSVSVFPRLRVTGQNLVLRSNGDTNGSPFISIQRFSAEANPLGLLWRPIKIGTVHLSGLSIVLPPHGERPRLEASTSSQAKSKAAFVIAKIVSDDARLELLTDKPGKIPLVFDILNLIMDSAGPGRAMPFTATLTNPKPIGDIAAKGEFGPWETQDPRDTPVSGKYSFTGADLSTIKGIGGILTSHGQFSGVLGKIEVRGETDTPDFRVDTGNHPMPLHTNFSATVDGSTGDTDLHPVNARLAGSEILANGSVVRDNNGRRVTLDVSASNARIEDLLKVAVKTDPPMLSGPVTLHVSFLLPSGGASVPDRLHLDGSFNLTEARFLHPDVQEKLDKLSARAQGKPKEAEQDDAPDVLSDLKGKFKLQNGVISLSNLTFKVPGGLITLAGDYQLDGQEFSFEGQARLDAELSQMTTGVKSFFLKAVDPIFAKQGAGTVLPIKISGTGANPKVALDFGKPRRGN
jgi:uncharacterized protein involved in outer membrane biogenesis